MKHNKKKAAALFMAAILGTGMTVSAQEAPSDGFSSAQSSEASQSSEVVEMKNGLAGSGADNSIFTENGGNAISGAESTDGMLTPSAAPSENSDAVEPGLFIKLLGNYNFSDGFYNNPYFGFRYSTQSAFNADKIREYLNAMNNIDESTYEELKAQLGANLGNGMSVCVMYALSPESEGNFPKINITVVQDDILLTSEDVQNALKSSYADIRAAIKDEFDVSEDHIIIGYERPADDPFSEMDSYYVTIQVTENPSAEDADADSEIIDTGISDTESINLGDPSSDSAESPDTDEDSDDAEPKSPRTYYSTQIYLFGSGQVSSDTPHFLCCITITASNPEDVSAVLGNLSVPGSAAAEAADTVTEPAPSPVDAGSDTSA